MNSLGTLIIIALMVLINLDVFGRNLLRAPVPGVIELAEMGIVAIVFLQLGHTLRVGRFTQSDGFLNILKRRVPKLSAALRLFFNLTGFVLSCLIIRAVSSRVADAWTGDYYKGNLGSFTAPTWPVELAILAGATAIAIQFFAFALINIAMLTGRADPSADEFEPMHSKAAGS